MGETGTFTDARATERHLGIGAWPAGLSGQPSVRVNGPDPADGEVVTYDPAARRAAVRINGTAEVEVRIKT